MRNYYTILGVASDASPDAIKAAYHRLALDNHPDRQSYSTDKTVVTDMAELNAAYSVLSHARKRREYDETLRLQLIAAVKDISMTQTVSGTAAQTKAVSRTGRPAPLRPRHETGSTVVSQFSSHLREQLLAKRSNLTWQKVELDGFDWGLDSSAWLSYFCVGLRGFTEADSATAKKFINYATNVIARRKQPLKKSHFAFLMPFQQLTEWESVSNQFQSFVLKPHPTIAAPTVVLLMEMHGGRTVRFGSSFADKRFEELLSSVRTSA